MDFAVPSGCFEFEPDGLQESANTPRVPHFLKNAFPRGSRSGWPDNGQMRAIASL
jgi:hypothetical protein